MSYGGSYLLILIAFAPFTEFLILNRHLSFFSSYKWRWSALFMKQCCNIRRHIGAKNSKWIQQNGRYSVLQHWIHEDELNVYSECIRLPNLQTWPTIFWGKKKVANFACHDLWSTWERKPIRDRKYSPSYSNMVLILESCKKKYSKLISKNYILTRLSNAQKNLFALRIILSGGKIINRMPMRYGYLHSLNH